MSGAAALKKSDFFFIEAILQFFDHDYPEIPVFTAYLMV